MDKLAAAATFVVAMISVLEQSSLTFLKCFDIELNIVRIVFFFILNSLPVLMTSDMFVVFSHDVILVMQFLFLILRVANFCQAVHSRANLILQLGSFYYTAQVKFAKSGFAENALSGRTQFVRYSIFSSTRV